MEKSPFQVLIVDDDPNLLSTLGDILKIKGFSVFPVSMGRAALDIALRRDIDVALIDLRLEDIPGLDVLRGIKEHTPDTECILLTGHASQDSAIQALNLGAYSFVQKPYDVDLLLLSIIHAAEKRATGKALKESERRHHTFINATSDMTFLKDDHFRYLLVNQSNANFFGKSIEEIIGREDFELMPPEAASACRLSDEHVLLTNSTVITHENVAGRTYETRKFPVPLQGGCLGVGGYIRDITDKVQAEQAMHESEAHYRGLFEDSPTSLWEEDFSGVKQRLEKLRRRGVKNFRTYFVSHPEVAAECVSLIRIVDVNKATLELYRAEEKQDLIKNAKISYWDDPESFTEELVQIAEGKTSFSWDGINHTLDGKRMDISMKWSVVPGHEEDLSRVIISVVDMTEHKQAEVRVKESEERYRRMFDDSPVALCEEDFSAVKKRLDTLHKKGVKDLRAYLKSHPEIVRQYSALIRIVDVNKTTLALYGAKDKDEMLKNLSLLLHEDSYEMFLEEIIYLWEGRKEFEVEGVNQTLDGERIAVSIKWSVSPGYEDDLSKVIISIVNITERKKAEDKTRRHLAEMEILYENGLAISRLLDPAEIGKRLIDGLSRHLSWHHMVIRLREGEVGNLKPVAFSQPGMTPKRQAAMPERLRSSVKDVGQGLTGWVMRTGKPLRTGNVSDNPHYVETEPGMISGLYVPLKIGKRLLGCISVESDEPDAFSAEDERLLITLANQAAIAFENAHLYKAMQDELTERRKVEVALRESEERYRMVTDNSTDMVWLMDMDLKTTFISPSVSRLTGYTLDEIKATPVERLLSADSFERATNTIKKELKPQKVARPDLDQAVNLELEYIRKDGSGIWTEMAYVLIRDKKGRPVNILGNGRDITDRRRAEDALRASEHRLQSILDHTSALVYIKDMDGHLLLVNNAYVDLTGTPLEKILGKTTFDLNPKDEAEQHDHNDRMVLKKGAPFTFEETFTQNDVSRTFLSVKFPLRGADGKVEALCGISTDITEQKKAEEQLQLLSRAVEQSPASIILTDPKGNIEYVNRRFSQVTGYPPEEVIGKNPRILKSGSTSREDYEALWKQITTGEEWRGEFRNRKKNGDLFWESAWISPIEDKNKRITHFLAVKEDITTRKGAEQAMQTYKVELEERVMQRTVDLSAANAALAKAARHKDEFLASMSHELRTPLTGVLGLTEAMQRKVYGELNPRQTEILSTIEESGRHLLNLINDILDLSKIEAGRMDLEIAKLSVDDLCQASLRLVKQMAANRHQSVSFDVEPTGSIIRADARRLKQVLFNLLGNAIKFTPENGQLGLEVRGDREHAQIRFTVWDRGIGISAEDLERLFQPFVQLDSSLARNYPGTGLGLSLARRLVELHGGRIEVESKVGQGSRFIVILPWIKSDTAPLPPAVQETSTTNSVSMGQKEQNSQHTILVADDNEVNIRLVEDYLASLGYQVTLSRNGYQTLEAVEQTRPDLILMDIQMPGMDGLEAIRRIRSLSDPVLARLPIIAVTALVMPGDRDRCLEAGANYYLTKPLNLGGLAEIIQYFLEKAR